MPDLRPAAEQNATVEALADAAAQQICGAEVVLVGHSGGGLLLPAITERTGSSVAAWCFVDAPLPPIVGEVPVADADFLTFLTSLASHGVLPPWSTWWGQNTMKLLVPDDVVRRELAGEEPRLPLAYFQGSVRASATVPATLGYVRLSALYEPHASAAESQGWPVYRFSEGHLHLVVDPGAVADRVLEVLGRPPTGRAVRA